MGNNMAEGVWGCLWGPTLFWLSCIYTVIKKSKQTLHGWAALTHEGGKQVSSGFRKITGGKHFLTETKASLLIYTFIKKNKQKTAQSSADDGWDDEVAGADRACFQGDAPTPAAETVLCWPEAPQRTNLLPVFYSLTCFLRKNHHLTTQKLRSM